MTDRELLEQALEALELRCGTHAHERDELIPALRKRLEQPESAMTSALAGELALSLALLRAENADLTHSIAHYECALLTAFPAGAQGEVFLHWNAARRIARGSNSRDLPPSKNTPCLSAPPSI